MFFPLTSQWTVCTLNSFHRNTIAYRNITVTLRYHCYTRRKSTQLDPRIGNWHLFCVLISDLWRLKPELKNQIILSASFKCENWGQKMWLVAKYVRRKISCWLLCIYLFKTKSTLCNKPNATLRCIFNYCQYLKHSISYRKLHEIRQLSLNAIIL